MGRGKEAVAGRGRVRKQTDWATTADAAEIIGTTRGTLDHWRSKGKGPPFYRIETNIIYSRVELAEWMMEHRVVPVG